MRADDPSIVDLSARLATYVERQFGWHLVEQIEVMSDGFASSVYGAGIRRRPPRERVTYRVVVKGYANSEAGRAIMATEERALVALSALGYKVPALIRAESCDGPLGFPFILMQRIVGDSVWAAYVEAKPARKRRIMERFVEGLTALHGRATAELMPESGVATENTHIDTEIHSIRAGSAAYPSLNLEPVLAWLDRNREKVSPKSPVVLHRDYHPWNALLDQGGRVWVVDWNWGLGDARFDVAWACTLMERSNYDQFSCDFKRVYEEQVGEVVTNWAFFRVLATARWLINVTSSEQQRLDQPMSDNSRFSEFLRGPRSKALNCMKYAMEGPSQP